MHCIGTQTAMSRRSGGGGQGLTALPDAPTMRRSDTSARFLDGGGRGAAALPDATIAHHPRIGRALAPRPPHLIHFRHWCLAFAVGLFFAGVPPHAFAQREPPPVKFTTTKGAVADRPQIRDFILGVQRELFNTLGLPPPPSDAPELAVEIGFARPFALASGHKLYRLPTGAIQAVVIVPDGDVTDWEQLRFCITAAIFRRELYARAKRGTRPTEPPVWFVRGLAMLTDISSRGRYFEQAYASWSHAALDGGSLLFGADSLAATRPAVASQLAAWCAERSDRRERWNALFDSLAAGEPWTPASIALIFNGSPNLANLDDSFDSWIASRSRRIFMPGTTTGGVIDRLRVNLLVFAGTTPPDAAEAFDGKAVLPLSWYVKNPDFPGAESVLRQHADSIRAAALGRDPEFRRMCGLYASALEVSAAKGWKKAEAYWTGAEKLRSDLEVRTASGEILGEEE